jgi:hypothetical protein
MASLMWLKAGDAQSVMPIPVLDLWVNEAICRWALSARVAWAVHSASPFSLPRMGLLL